MERIQHAIPDIYAIRLEDGFLRDLGGICRTSLLDSTGRNAIMNILPDNKHIDGDSNNR